ncbi:MAG: TRAP transporter small permease [Desulfatiglandaceae bacterium]|jgi:TRAP-type transport system small permease protein
METKPPARGFESWVNLVAKYADHVTWGVLFFLMVITMADVFLRKIFHTSILGTVEITELSMAAIVFCSLAECQVHDGHIKVDILLKGFSKRVQAVFDLITQTACFLFFSMMTWAMFHYAIAMKEGGEVTIDLSLPKYPIVWVACAGCALLAMVLLCKSLKALREVFES